MIISKRANYPWMKILCLLFVHICFVGHVKGSSVSEEKSFIWLSDIHYDELFGGEESAGGDQCRNLDGLNPSQSMPPLGCECNLGLMNEILRHASDSDSQSTTTKPSMVIVSGDLCRHDMGLVKQNPYGRFLSTITTTSRAIRSYFSHDIPIIFTSGNNDVYPDYTLDLGVLGDVESQLQEPFGPNTLGALGYVDYDVFPDLTILSLNTNMFSLKLTMDAEAAKVLDPEKQWKWVESQLKRCRNLSRNVWILGHIPPTIQSYDMGKSLWKDEHVDRYRHLLREFNDVIQTQLFAHVHTSEFRLFAADPKDDDSGHQKPKYISGIAPLWITAAVSPIYQNLPSYHTVTYNLSQPNNIIDIYPHVYNLKDYTWLSVPSFREAYGNLPDLSSETVQKHIVEPVLSSSSDKGVDIFRTFMYRLKYNPPSDLCDSLSCRVRWGCTWISNNEKEYTTCLNFHMPRTSSSSKVAAAILMALMLSLLVGIVIFGARRKFREDRLTKANAAKSEDSLWSSTLEEEENDYSSISKNFDNETKNIPTIT